MIDACCHIKLLRSKWPCGFSLTELKNGILVAQRWVSETSNFIAGSFRDRKRQRSCSKSGSLGVGTTAGH